MYPFEEKDIAKKLIVVYGENGVGKSNFASAFFTLYESMQTLSVRKAIMAFLEDKKSMQIRIHLLERYPVS